MNSTQPIMAAIQSAPVICSMVCSKQKSRRTIAETTAFGWGQPDPQRGSGVSLGRRICQLRSRIRKGLGSRRDIGIELVDSRVRA